ncbi:MAG: hypothetical protein ISS82_03420 [Nanoarchaeota archaeon]|nr:hypothetical protein [Nanoarchaeota archaeon]
MNPDKLQDLVTIAFCIEAISDKKGCTTRYTDLHGKPLENFIIAGINTGKYFRELASDILNNKNPNIFDYFVPALKACNLYKSQKTINFGLLEIMFPTVYARLISENSSEVIGNIINLMKKENTEDVQNLINAKRRSMENLY